MAKTGKTFRIRLKQIRRAIVPRFGMRGPLTSNHTTSGKRVVLLRTTCTAYDVTFVAARFSALVPAYR
jgi:hypothetical protein